MKLEDAIGLRDEIATAYIVHSFPEKDQEQIRKTVIAAFQKAASDWVESYLPNLGVGKPDELKKQLQNDFPGPNP